MWGKIVQFLPLIPNTTFLHYNTQVSITTTIFPWSLPEACCPPNACCGAELPDPNILEGAVLKKNMKIFITLLCTHTHKQARVVVLNRVWPDTGYWNYQAGQQVLSDIQPYFTVVIRISNNLVFYTKQNWHFPTEYPAKPDIRPNSSFEFTDQFYIYGLMNINIMLDTIFLAFRYQQELLRPIVGKLLDLLEIPIKHAYVESYKRKRREKRVYLNKITKHLYAYIQNSNLYIAYLTNQWTKWLIIYWMLINKENLYTKNFSHQSRIAAEKFTFDPYSFLQYQPVGNFKL